MMHGNFHRGRYDASINAQWDADENRQHGGLPSVGLLCARMLEMDPGEKDPG